MASITKFHHAIKTSNKSRMMCGTVVRRLRKPKSSSILRRHYRQRLVSLLALKDFKRQNLPQLLTPPQSSDEESSTISPIYHVTTKRSILKRLKLSELRNSFGSRRMARKQLRRECSTESMSVQQPAQPERQNTAPETAVPHFATAYLTGTQMPNFDRNSYAAITSIQQRRQYKVVYEQDYDEYCQLLARIEKMQRDYQLLTQQVQRVPVDSDDYEGAKERILAYYRKNSELMFQQTYRFHYLGIKLAYIRKLVADFDESFTSNSAAARLAAAARDYLQRQQMDFMSTSETGFGRFGTMLREHANTCYNLQPPALKLTVANLQQHDKQQEQIGVKLNYRENINGNAFGDWNPTTATRLDNNDPDDDESTDTDSSYNESTDTESYFSEPEDIAYDDGVSNDTDIDSNTDEK